MCYTLNGSSGRGQKETEGIDRPGAREMGDPPAPSGWKADIEENFRLWLKQVEDSDPAFESSREEAPDLYSFFEQLAALKNEFRKGARRSHDTFVRFADALGTLEQTIQAISARMNEDRAVREEADLMARRSLYLSIVEVFERFRRVEERMARPPGGWGFFKARRRHEAWFDVKEGLEILGAHLEGLLKGEGVTAMETAGRPFDPALMIAVEARDAQTVEPGTVLEEVSRGYLHRGKVLKLAEVVVARAKTKGEQA